MKTRYLKKFPFFGSFSNEGPPMEKPFALAAKWRKWGAANQMAACTVHDKTRLCLVTFA